MGVVLFHFILAFPATQHINSTLKLVRPRIYILSGTVFAFVGVFVVVTFATTTAAILTNGALVILTLHGDGMLLLRGW